MKRTLCLAVLSGLASTAGADSWMIQLVPSAASVQAGDSFTVDVNAIWSGIPDAGNGNAFAGFGLTLGAVNGLAGVDSFALNTATQFNPSFLTGSGPSAASAGAVTAFGGQLPNLEGTFNPSINLGNPVRLFTFTVNTASGFDGQIVIDVTDQPNDFALAVVYGDSRSAAQVSVGLDDSQLIVQTASVDVIGCPADLTGSSDPNDPAYGVPDGLVDAGDFFYYLDQFVGGNLAVADLTGSSDPNDPSYGSPDGDADADDFFFYLDQFVADCL